MRWLAVLLFVIVTPRSADAGLVCSEEAELDGFVAQLEAVAKSPAKAADLVPHWRYCLDGDHKRKARIVKACTAIVARLDVTKTPNDDAQHSQHACIPVLAAYGVNPIKTKTK